MEFIVFWFMMNVVAIFAVLLSERKGYISRELSNWCLLASQMWPIMLMILIAVYIIEYKRERMR